MRVLFSGASGLVGSGLISRISANHEVVQLVRRTPATGQWRWQPRDGQLPGDCLDGIDGVIHLGGTNIASGRWTDSMKQKIRDSRLISTRLLAETMANRADRPQFFICASAIGYYGDRGDELLTESSAAGTGFLPQLCRDWEAATQPAKDAGIRVIHARIGVVLSKHGGALAKMLPPFRMGLGGVVGNGHQYMSYISLSELTSVVEHLISHDGLEGPVNVVAPDPRTNREFTKALGRLLHRPTLLPLPGFAVKWIMGEMGESLLLHSSRVIPLSLQDSGYVFQDADLEASLRSGLTLSPH